MVSLERLFYSIVFLVDVVRRSSASNQNEIVTSNYSKRILSYIERKRNIIIPCVSCQLLRKYNTVFQVEEFWWKSLCFFHWYSCHRYPSCLKAESVPTISSDLWRSDYFVDRQKLWEIKRISSVYSFFRGRDSYFFWLAQHFVGLKCVTLTNGDNLWHVNDGYFTKKNDAGTYVCNFSFVGFSRAIICMYNI